MTSAANATVTFVLEENQDFLQLDKFTGQLWFKQAEWRKDFTAYYKLVVRAERQSDGATARMTIDLYVVPFDDAKDFCERFFCFYESVTYHAIEDFEENFKSHEIGEFSSKIFTRLCKNFEASYELLNGRFDLIYWLNK